MLETAPPGARPTEPAATNHRRILATAALLGGATIVAKFAAFAKDWLVALRFGASDELDAFLVAFMIPSFAVAVVANSFGSAFLPTYLRTFQQQGAESARRLVSSLLACGIIVLATLTLLLAAAAHPLMSWASSSLNGPTAELAENLFYLVIGILFANGLSAVWSAILNANGRFAMTAGAGIVVPTATVIVFWVFQARLGIYALALGTLLGFALECIVLAVRVAWLGLLPLPHWGGWPDSLKNVGWQYLHAATGCLLMSSSIVVDQTMAARLGSGNVSILNYGNKVISLILSIVAVSLSTVLFPQFSRMINGGEWEALNRTVRVCTRFILLTSIPLAGFLVVFSEPIVRVFFERGAFTAETTGAVSYVQVYFALQIPFYILNMLGVRLLSALDGNQIVLGIGAINLVLNVSGNLIFMHWFGVAGIAMSTSAMYVISALITSTAIRSKIAEVRRR